MMMRRRTHDAERHAADDAARSSAIDTARYPLLRPHRATQTQRGGDMTFHGPGQLVGYPILDLRRFGLRVRAYIGMLEDMLIRTCAQFGVPSIRTDDTGVWAADGRNKLAAIGARMRHWGALVSVRPDHSCRRFVRIDRSPSAWLDHHAWLCAEL